ncbi:hypothetical protein PXK56_18445 [Phaeobacter gallaeciensis]|uniref:hypothetical protein n=1 Tax=Phaeobacter gallaeciensis TaxID=60890 RepID=UPI0023809924|nr:hypothetical protein [Phaeobacter gallaeciensis]MDE4297168.1 hypothetical protein [Phaeobacter gallaeciensis]
MSMADAFAPADAAYRAEVLANTWGHLAPQVGRVYSGWVVFTVGCFGDITIIDYELEDLPSSPWFFQDINNFVGEQIEKKKIDRGQVWRWDGTFKVLKNGRSRWSGGTRPCRINTRFGKGPSL